MSTRIMRSPAIKAADGAVAAHLIWCALAGVVLAASALSGTASLSACAAFAVLGAAPTLILLAVRERLSREHAALALALAWAGATAVALTISQGGSDWALVAWAAAPMAAVWSLGARKLVLEAAVLGAAAIVIPLVLHLSDLAGTANAGIGLGVLPLFSAAAMIVFCGACFAMEARADARRSARSDRLVAKARALLADLPFAVMRVRADGAIADIAGAFEPVMNAEAARCVGRQSSELADARGRAAYARALDKALRFREPQSARFAAAGRHVDAQITPRGVDEALVIVTLADENAASNADLIAERDAAIARSEAKSRFFAGLSHELRTPLNAILGFSESMRTRIFGPLPEKYAEYVDIIHESANHLLELIGSVLDLSKIESGRYELEVEALDAEEIVGAALRLTRTLADAKGVTLTKEISEAGADISADAMALKQILLNLLSNAIKFTPEDGEVRVRVERSAGEHVLEVVDTGCGIAADEVIRLGRPYAQTASGKASAHKGTGLGLAIVRGLAELHGGRLEVESKLGRGTTMRVILPVNADAAGPRANDEGLDARAQLERVRNIDWGGGRG